MGIAAHPTSLINTNHILICAAEVWTLTGTGELCPDTISFTSRDSLGDCKTHCEANGARRLTFFPKFDALDPLCRCCTASSELWSYDNDSQTYTLLGKYMYLPTTNWCQNTLFA